METLKARVKILCLVTNDLVTDQRMIRICTTLTDAGYDVTLIGRLLPNSPPLSPSNFSQRRLKVNFTKGPHFYIAYNIRLAWLLLFAKYDVVNAIDLDTIVPAVIVGKLRGKKVVYDAHEYFSEVPEVINRPRIQKIWEWVGLTFVKKCDAAYTVGPCLAQIMTQAYELPFQIVRNTPQITYLAKENEISSYEIGPLLYQGALNKGRALEVLIDAAPQLPCKVWIVGDGDLSHQLQERANKLGLIENGKVKFFGRVSPQDLTKLTQEAWVGYNLLENLGKSYYYSLANKFFDYIGAGIPSLCPPFPEYETINNEFGGLCLITNPTREDIVSSINKLAQDKSLFERFKVNCLEARAFLTWEQDSKELLQVYSSLFRA